MTKNSYGIYISPNVYCKNGKICIKGECKDFVSFEDKLFIFEDTLKGWFFEPLSILANEYAGDINFKTGFIILNSSIAYIELFGSLIEGRFGNNNNSGELFKKGLNCIFCFCKESDNKIIADGLFKSLNSCSYEEIPNDEKNNIQGKIYNLIRNGLAHQFFFKGVIREQRRIGVIYTYTNPYAFLIEKSENEELIIINPKEFLESLKASLDAYLNFLKLCRLKNVLKTEIPLLKFVESSNCRKLIKNFENIFLEFHGKYKVFCGGYQSN